jgi:hypothetical protein
MVTRDVKPLTQIKPVCTESLHPGIQMQFPAIEIARMGLEPLEHFSTGAPGTMTLRGDEVVNVDMLSPRQFRSHYKARDAQDFSLRFDVGYLISMLFLFLDLREQLLLCERRPQLQQNPTDQLELIVRFGDADLHGGQRGLLLT